MENSNTQQNMSGSLSESSMISSSLEAESIIERLLSENKINVREAMILMRALIKTNDIINVPGPLYPSAEPLYPPFPQITYYYQQDSCSNTL